MCGVPSGVQSSFNSGYGCVTATLKILNYIYITSALHVKQPSAAIVIDLAKAFNTVDHTILMNRLGNIVVTDHLVFSLSFSLGATCEV